MYSFHPVQKITKHDKLHDYIKQPALQAVVNSKKSHKTAGYYLKCSPKDNQFSAQHFCINLKYETQYSVCQ